MDGQEIPFCISLVLSSVTKTEGSKEHFVKHWQSGSISQSLVHIQYKTVLWGLHRLVINYFIFCKVHVQWWKLANRFVCQSLHSSGWDYYGRLPWDKVTLKLLPLTLDLQWDCAHRWVRPSVWLIQLELGCWWNKRLKGAAACQLPSLLWLKGLWQTFGSATRDDAHLAFQKPAAAILVSSTQSEWFQHNGSSAILAACLCPKLRWSYLSRSTSQNVSLEYCRW